MSIPQAIPTSTQTILNALYDKAKYDGSKVTRALLKGLFSKITPWDVGTAFLPISQEQGNYLFHLICEKNLKNIVEFGTSFGISTLFMAEAVKTNGGHITTTEIVPSKCKQANLNFSKAGLQNHITLLEGDACITLKQLRLPIDLLILDGWKDLYLPVFRLLEPLFHKQTLIFVDNVNMKGVKHFMKEISLENEKYKINNLQFEKGNTALITIK